MLSRIWAKRIHAARGPCVKQRGSEETAGSLMQWHAPTQRISLHDALSRFGAWSGGWVLPAPEGCHLLSKRRSGCMSRPSLLSLHPRKAPRAPRLLRQYVLLLMVCSDAFCDACRDACSSLRGTLHLFTRPCANDRRRLHLVTQPRANDRRRLHLITQPRANAGRGRLRHGRWHGLRLQRCGRSNFLAWCVRQRQRHLSAGSLWRKRRYRRWWRRWQMRLKRSWCRWWRQWWRRCCPCVGWCRWRRRWWRRCPCVELCCCQLPCDRLLLVRLVRGSCRGPSHQQAQLLLP